MDNTDNLFTHFVKLGFTADQAKIYIALLRRPATPSQLSQLTGINRSKIYRLAEFLEKRSLISLQSDARGTFLVAADPSALQIELINRNQVVRQQRAVLASLIPSLEHLRRDSDNDFVLHTYEGIDGFKQMLWHELKAKGECLCFGFGELESLVPDSSWTEQQRSRTVEASYTIRELCNPGGKKPDFTKLEAFKKRHTLRIIPREALSITQQTVIYNDTVSIYNWRDAHKVGIEIISQTYATMMRQMFEMYWKQAGHNNA